MATPTDSELRSAISLKSADRKIPAFGTYTLGTTFPIDEKSLDEIAKGTKDSEERDMRHVCPFGYWQEKGDPDYDETDNHCAHFVSHVIGFASPSGKHCATRAADKAWQRYVKLKAASNPTNRPKYDKLIASEGKLLRAEGVCIQVVELFAACAALGAIRRWDERAAEDTTGLIFLAAANNIAKSDGTYRIGSGPKKHVGVFVGDNVWHFSNSRGRVVKQAAADMTRHYGAGTVLVYSAKLPPRNWSPPAP